MLKYIGNGAALVVDQVPARDLTDEEVTQFGEGMLLASGLYAKPEREAVRFSGTVSPVVVDVKAGDAIEVLGDGDGGLTTTIYPKKAGK